MTDSQGPESLKLPKDLHEGPVGLDEEDILVHAKGLIEKVEEALRKSKVPQFRASTGEKYWERESVTFPFEKETNGEIQREIWTIDWDVDKGNMTIYRDILGKGERWPKRLREEGEIWEEAVVYHPIAGGDPQVTPSISHRSLGVYNNDGDTFRDDSFAWGRAASLVDRLSDVLTGQLPTPAAPRV